MTWTSVQRCRSSIWITAGRGRGRDEMLLPIEDARELMHQLQGVFSAVACPPDCCGRQTEPVRMVIDGIVRDCWRCSECGALRTRRV